MASFETYNVSLLLPSHSGEGEEKTGLHCLTMSARVIVSGETTVSILPCTLVYSQRMCVSNP